MPDASTLALFAAAALALIVIPGPAVLYIVAQGIDRGRLAGVVSALGVATGGLLHVLAAAVGISSLVVSSAAAGRSASQPSLPRSSSSAAAWVTSGSSAISASAALRSISSRGTATTTSGSPVGRTSGSRR